MEAWIGLIGVVVGAAVAGGISYLVTCRQLAHAKEMQEREFEQSMRRLLIDSYSDRVVLRVMEDEREDLMALHRLICESPFIACLPRLLTLSRR